MLLIKVTGIIKSNIGVPRWVRSSFGHSKHFALITCFVLGGEKTDGGAVSTAWEPVYTSAQEPIVNFSRLFKELIAK